MYKHIIKALQLFTIFTLVQVNSFAQSGTDTPKQYEIKEIKIEGISYLQPGPIIRFTGLRPGKKIVIPGNDISAAIDKLWKQGLFEDVQIYAEKIDESTINLIINVEERARLSKIIVRGTKKSMKDDIEELVDLKSGMQITTDIVNNAERKIKEFYLEKGFLNAQVKITQEVDTSHKNLNFLYVDVDKGKRIKIEDIVFYGTESIKTGKLYRTMKETKRNLWYNIFKRSKYIPKKYKEDKQALVDLYIDEGYRDISISKDSIEIIDSNNIKLHLYITEGSKYYFRNITWVGNKKYNTEILNSILNIKKGATYNETLLNDRLFGLEGVSSIYLDNGYLFFNADPVEILIENDSIDIEIRIYEGQQARINKVIVLGNDKTSDHVIRREIRTKPGELFRRSDIIRTQRELAQMGYFDPESMGVNPKPNPQDGTVDIEYTLQEKSSDQVELSGGWGGYFVGSVRLVLNNFSTKRFFDKESWSPFPSGDGQRLSLSVSSNPKRYSSYNFSFTEPWLGGKKPNSLTVQVYHSVSKRTTGSYYDYSKATVLGFLKVTGTSVGLAKRLTWPDDWFTWSNSIGYQHYNLDGYYDSYDIDGKDSIRAHNISLTTVLSRNSTDQPLYPTRGTIFTAKLEITPPYSMLNSDKREGTFSTATEDKYRWIEYHKWSLNGEGYYNIIDKLVLRGRFQYGFLGYYNKSYKSPFEQFEMGGDGLSGYQYYGLELIPLRGYDAKDQIPTKALAYAKYSAELRYPITQSQSATIYGLVFAEAGNAWTEFEEFNPFSLYRSAGAGIRLFLPMLGLVGFDFGYGFDNINVNSNKDKWKPHIILGQQL